MRVKCYAWYCFAKYSCLAALLLVLGVVRHTAIQDSYGSKEACDQCYDASLVNPRLLFEFGKCSELYESHDRLRFAHANNDNLLISPYAHVAPTLISAVSSFVVSSVLTFVLFSFHPFQVFTGSAFLAAVITCLRRYEDDDEDDARSLSTFVSLAVIQRCTFAFIIVLLIDAFSVLTLYPATFASPSNTLATAANAGTGTYQCYVMSLSTGHLIAAQMLLWIYLMLMLCSFFFRQRSLMTVLLEFGEVAVMFSYAVLVLVGLIITSTASQEKLPAVFGVIAVVSIFEVPFLLYGVQALTSPFSAILGSARPDSPAAGALNDQRGGDGAAAYLLGHPGLVGGGGAVGGAGNANNNRAGAAAGGGGGGPYRLGGSGNNGSFHDRVGADAHSASELERLNGPAYSFHSYV